MTQNQTTSSHDAVPSRTLKGVSSRSLPTNPRCARHSAENNHETRIALLLQLAVLLFALDAGLHARTCSWP